MSQYLNLTDKEFGKLKVIRDVGRSKGGAVIWLCLCSCGNFVIVRGSDLKNGHTQSCGCYNKQRTTESHSREKNHNWKGGVTKIRFSVRNSSLYLNWRLFIFQRDDYTCQNCLHRGGKLEGHHIIPFSVIMNEHNIQTLEEAEACKELWDTNNGITLCRKCHRKLPHPKRK